ncbi:MAG: AMP-binding protein, partial [Candidatus Omnitrophica bacterium]|nr:AMP-binding protein [Candidatus Omnitrophota bacterium]
MESSLIHRKFEKACSKYPDKPALIFQEDNRFFKLTFSQVLDYSGRITGLLKEYGLSFSQRVAIYMENNPFWFSAYLGIVSAGLTAVPMDYMLSKDEVTNILIDSESKVVFCSRNSIKDLQGLDTPFLKDLKIVCLDSDFIKGLKINNQSLLDFDQESIASLLYTSGTTDNPKAVCLSHKNLMTNFADIYKLGFYGDKDIFLCILPLHHAYPFMVNLLVPLFVGSSVVLPKSLRAKDILFCLRRQGVSIFVGVPQVFSLIYQNLCQKLKAFEFIIKVLGNLRSKTGINISKAVFFFVHRKFGRSLRFLVCGGAKLDEKIAAGFFNLGFDIMEGYGLTETSPVVSFNPPKKAKIGSVGKPLISVAVRIHNPNRQGQGEILVKGGSVTKGYFRKPHLTAESLKDGWFFTKDIGYLDKDNYLYITGRKDECIVLSSGKNIWPKELEQVYASRPSIKEICIFNRLDHLYAVVVPDKSYFTKAEALDYHGRIKKDIEEVS